MFFSIHSILSATEFFYNVFHLSRAYQSALQQEITVLNVEKTTQNKYLIVTMEGQESHLTQALLEGKRYCKYIRTKSMTVTDFIK